MAQNRLMGEWDEESETEESETEESGIEKSEAEESEAKKSEVEKSGVEESRIIREGGRSYLLRPIADTEHSGKSDKEEQERFLALQIAGLLPCSVRYRNGSAYFYYDVTGRQAMSGLYKEADMSYGECCALLLSLERALQNIREYLLDENCLCLAADMVFMSINKNEAAFTYDPTQESCFQEEVRTLAEFVLSHAGQQDERAVVLSCQFYKYALADNFNMEEFLLENRQYILLGGTDEPVKTEDQKDVPYDGDVPEDTAPEEEYYELWLP